ncbi:hypothetical protein NUKP84_12690 [Klebsiella variicola]|nr:hypothetical protein NUKP84_12690 [Klebsiella variicola]
MAGGRECLRVLEQLQRSQSKNLRLRLCVQMVCFRIAAKTVTYDFERLMEGAKLLKCSEFGDAIIANM